MIMQITFNPGKSDILTMEFDTKVSWDNYMSTCREPGQLRPFNSLPESFPCLMLYDGNLLPIDGEHRTFYNLFVYSYSNT